MPFQNKFKSKLSHENDWEFSFKFLVRKQSATRVRARVHTHDNRDRETGKTKTKLKKKIHRTDKQMLINSEMSVLEFTAQQPCFWVSLSLSLCVRLFVCVNSDKECVSERWHSDFCCDFLTTEAETEHYENAA